MKEIGSMTSSTDTDVKHGMKAKSSSKANTTKEKRMEKEDTNGPTEVITKETSLIAFSRARGSTISQSLKELTKACLQTTCSRVRVSLPSKMDVCTKEISDLARKRDKARWSSLTETSILDNGKMMCSTESACTIQQKRESKSKVTMQTVSALRGLVSPSKWAVRITEKATKRISRKSILNAD